MENVTCLTVQSALKHGIRMIGNIFPTRASKERKLNLVSIFVTGLAFRDNILRSGYGFMLNGKVTILAFDFMVGHVVLVNKIRIIIFIHHTHIRMTGITSLCWNRTITDLHLAVTFFTINILINNKLVVILDVMIFRSHRCCVAFCACIHRTVDRLVFKMTQKTGRFCNCNMFPLDDLGVAAGTPQLFSAAEFCQMGFVVKNDLFHEQNFT